VLGRLLLVGGGLILALLITEAALRVIYADLPSLDALSQDPDWELRRMKRASFIRPETDPGDRRCLGSSYIAGSQGVEIFETSFGPASAAPFSLWIFGDSLARGYGVKKGQGLGSLLGKRLAGHLGARVTVRNLGINGGGFCETFTRMQIALDGGGVPDAVVVLFFSDDLNHRVLMAIEDRPMGFPDRARSRAARYLAQRSYVANLAWYASVIHGHQPQVEAFVQKSTRDLFVGAVTRMRQRLSRLGAPMIIALTVPAGLHLCPGEPKCLLDWREAALIARLLRRADAPFVDLRKIWSGRPSMVIPRERHMLIGIHPDAQGHRAMAETVWPHLQRAVKR